MEDKRDFVFDFRKFLDDRFFEKLNFTTGQNKKEPFGTQKKTRFFKLWKKIENFEIIFIVFALVVD